MKAFGWKQDPYDARDWAAHKRVMVRKPTIARPDLTMYRRGRLLQGGAGSCVAQAITRAVHVAQLQRNDAAPMPSAMMTYWLGRKQEQAGKDPTTAPPLADEGTFPRLAMRAVRSLGFVTSERCPYDDRAVNVELDEGLLQHSYDQNGLGYSRVLDSGLSRSEMAAECLMRGSPVIFGAQVDKAWFDVNTSVPISAINENEIVGGHMLEVVRVQPNGNIVFDNWWSDWGFDDGLGIMSAELFGSVWIDDVYAIDFAPQIGAP